MNRTALAAALMSDQQLYADNAYGTPHEPYLRGQIGYVNRANSLAWRPGAGATIPDPVPVAPDNALTARYLDTYKRSLRDPILSHGLDFSRMAAVPKGQPFPSVGDRWWQRAGTWLMGTEGLHSPASDAIVSSQGPDQSPGLVDQHEFLHRGLSKLGITPDNGFQHELMGAQDVVDQNNPPLTSDRYARNVATPEMIDALMNLRALASDEIAKKRPMGPR